MIYNDIAFHCYISQTQIVHYFSIDPLLHRRFLLRETSSKIAGRESSLAESRIDQRHDCQDLLFRPSRPDDLDSDR